MLRNRWDEQEVEHQLCCERECKVEIGMSNFVKKSLSS